jgi:hypothetical protein
MSFFASKADEIIWEDFSNSVNVAILFFCIALSKSRLMVLGVLRLERILSANLFNDG